MNPENLSLFLPRYLSPESEAQLFSDLGSFPGPSERNYYASRYAEPTIIYQGDVLLDLPIAYFPEFQIKKRKGLVISNTCDIDLANPRNYPQFGVFVPVMAVEDFEKMLHAGGISAERVTSIVVGIRQQRITGLFYLPTSQYIPESVAFLDRPISMPNTLIDRNLTQSRVCSLSTTGHYLLLYKLSVHFTRLMEKIDRGYV